jgi:serine/threonine-protein kinase
MRRAVELDGATPAIRVELGRLELTAARYAAAKGEDPARFLAAAKEALEPTLRVNANHAPTLAALAEVYTLRAEHAKMLHLKAGEEISQGLNIADKALANFPNMPLALAAKGTLHLLRARAGSGAAQKEGAHRAVELLEEALKKNPLLPQRIKDYLGEARKLYGG